LSSKFPKIYLEYFSSSRNISLILECTQTFSLDDNWRNFEIECDDFKPQSKGKNNFFTTQFVRLLVKRFSLNFRLTCSFLRTVTSFFFISPYNNSSLLPLEIHNHIDNYRGKNIDGRWGEQAKIIEHNDMAQAREKPQYGENPLIKYSCYFSKVQ